MTGNTTVTATITKLDYRADTAYVPTSTPALTWVTTTEIPDWRQSYAELESDGTVERIDGRDSVRVSWPFTPLAPRERRRIRVRVHGEDGSASAWSEWTPVEGGFLADGEWAASAIGLAQPGRAGQPALLRSEFESAGTVAKATLYSTAQGVYQVELNGTAVDHDTLKPGWTAYQWRLIHETVDVTKLVCPGTNAIGIELAAGWFSEKYGFGEDAAPFYGPQPAAAAQLVIEYEDGTSEVVVTDEDWKSFGDGPVVSASIYHGQHDDARKAVPGWSRPGFDDSAWGPVRIHDAPTPEPRMAPPVRVVAELPVLEATTAPSGVTVLDFGKNLVGRVRVRADLPAGTTITLHHAEILTDGELDSRTMRGAAVTDSFTSAGEAVEWEPQYTFRGFRYAGVEGWTGAAPADAFTAVVVSSDLERTGWLETSNPLVDELHESIVWSTRGNFVSLPTDCPQRDERLGWTGDIEVFAPTAATLFDVDGFLTNWLADSAKEQDALNGVVPFVIPNISGVFTAATAGWGDSAVGVPWTLYQWYHDVTILERQYDSMKAWVDLIADKKAGDAHLWKGGFQFGDWLDPTAPPEFPTEAKADKELIASAYFYRSARILAEAAGLLGKAEDAAAYAELAAAIKTAFNAEYVTPNGRLSSDAQASYALAIAFDLASDDTVEAQMGAYLAGLVRRNGYRIGTGFLGTPVIAEALTRTGQAETADRLLTQTECPSWLYPITMGATTTWEAWDALRPDGSVSPRNTSFNHYAFGAVAAWLYARLAGLSAAEPAYRTIRIAPTPLDSFDRASATQMTPYGLASVGWARSGGLVTVRAVVPANTTALVQLPDGSAPFTVGSGSHEWTVERTPSPVVRVNSLSMASDLVDIIQDPDAYRTVIAAMEKHAPHAAGVLKSHTHWEPGVALNVELFILPKQVQEAIDGDLSNYRPAG